MTRATSVEQYKLVSSYETIRKQLLDDKSDGHLEKPLAHWALPSDRRLPLALLDRSLQELLACGFDELSSTPGIGQKKMEAMIKLLLRAAKEESPQAPFGISGLADEQRQDTANDGNFDPSSVSESEWMRWQETVRRQQLEHEPLGRLAPSLEDLPTVIWDTPLGFYLELSLREIRKLKTHGEKRVAVVMEVFRSVHSLLSAVPRSGTLSVRLGPRLIHSVEDWLMQVRTAEALPTEDDVRTNLTLPLLRQAKLDVGPTIHGLAEGRLGMRGAPQSVRAQSKRLGVTRARVYQLLDEAAAAMAVRWPQGRCLLRSMSEMLQQAGADEQQRGLLDATRELFFPEKQQEDDGEA